MEAATMNSGKRYRKSLLAVMRYKHGSKKKIQDPDLNTSIQSGVRQQLISHKDLISKFNSHLKFKKKNASGVINFFVKRKAH